LAVKRFDRPRLFVSDDCVEDDEQLARRCDDRDELWLAGATSLSRKALRAGLYRAAAMAPMNSAVRAW